VTATTRVKLHGETRAVHGSNKTTSAAASNNNINSSGVLTTLRYTAKRRLVHALDDYKIRICCRLPQVPFSLYKLQQQTEARFSLSSFGMDRKFQKKGVYPKWCKKFMVFEFRM
ncbi:hypothetical protein AABB24_005354, partial [Solanum stoloniferum]